MFGAKIHSKCWVLIQTETFDSNREVKIGCFLAVAKIARNVWSVLGHPGALAPRARPAGARLGCCERWGPAVGKKIGESKKSEHFLEI